LVLPYADTEAMNLHLAEIARAVTPGAHAVLVLDGAGWHGGGELVLPDNISLLTLPPYAPELNPIENVWDYLSKNKLAITLFDTYDDIVDTCCEAWNFFANDPATVASITSRNWVKAGFTLQARHRGWRRMPRWVCGSRGTFGVALRLQTTSSIS
jgi:transposase